MRKPEAPTRGTLLGTSAYIFLIRFFPTLASVAALIWLSRYMTPAWYGRYQSFWVQWQVLHVLATLGLPTLVLTYPVAVVNGLVRGAGRRQLSGLAAWVLLLSGGLWGMQWALGSPFAAWQAALFLVLGVPVAVLEAYALLGRQFRAVALVSIGYAGLFGLVHALLIGRILSSEHLMNGLLLGSALRLAALARLGYRQYRQQPAEVVAWGAVRSLWAHTALNEVVQILFRWVDKLTLNFLLPAALFALYFNGTLDVPFLPLLLGAAGSALLLHFGEPELSDAERIRTLRRAAAVLGRLVFPLFFFLLFFRVELFGVVFRHRYDAAVPLFLLSSLVIPLRAYNFTALLQHKGEGRTITTGAILDLLLALALMYPLYRWLGLGGVALAFVISTYGQAAFYLWHTARLLHVGWPELLPWKTWLVQLAGFGLGGYLLHWVLAQYVPEAGTLWTGAGVVLGLLAGQLWQVRRQQM